MCAMMRAQDHQDIRLRAEEGVCVGAHRCLLALASDKLCALFRQVTLDARAQELYLVGHSARTVKLFVHYVYTCEDVTRGLSAQEIVDLLLFANEYLCLRLQRICEHRLGAMVCAENVHSLTHMAQALYLEHLAVFCTRFLRQSTKLQQLCNIEIGSCTAEEADWIEFLAAAGSGYLDAADTTHWLCMVHPAVRASSEDVTRGLAACVCSTPCQCPRAKGLRLRKMRLDEAGAVALLTDPLLHSQVSTEERAEIREAALCSHRERESRDAQRVQDLTPNSFCLLARQCELLRSGLMCDVIVVSCDQTTRLCAHRCVLSLHSDKFSALFRFHAAEWSFDNQPPAFTLNSTDGSSLTLLLQYMYTGERVMGVHTAHNNVYRLRTRRSHYCTTA
jgi:hypothetical protein